MKKLLQAISHDRISALPEPIIHSILSFLPSKSVKLASSLSKTWYDLCSSFPYLDFIECIVDEDAFDPNLKQLKERYFNYNGENLRRFHERNPGILIRRIRIHIILCNSRFASLLSDWIKSALEHGVEMIDLITRGYYYNLPGALFASNSIRVLKVAGCSLLKTFCHGEASVSSSNLRKLVIKGVYIDELALRSVISICPLMEKLVIEDAMGRGITNLRISRSYKLKSLVVTNFVSEDIKMVEVDAPMLRSLVVWINSKFCTRPTKIGILDCPRLAKLSLNNVDVENCKLEEILSSLPFLSSLSLTDLLSLTKFKISNDSLNRLEVVGCTHLVELEIDAPKLFEFEFEFDGNIVPLMAPMHTIMGKSYITLDIGWEQSLYDNFDAKLSSFLSRLEHVNYLCLNINKFAMSSIDELEERVVQPVTDIEELKIIVQIPKGLLGIFNGLLWRFHPRILMMQLDLFENDVMTFLRDIVTGVGSCCSSIQARSWHNYLEKITIVADKATEIQLPMDGTVPSIALEESYFQGEIKFVFKW